VGQIEVDLLLAADAEAVAADQEDLARRDVARDEVAVGGVFLLEEIPAFLLGNRGGIPLVPGRSWDPHAPPLAPGRFRHQPQLVASRDRGRVHLDELAVRIGRAVLVGGRGRGTRVDDRVGRAAEDDAGTAGREHHRRRREGLDPHRVHVQRHNAAAVSRLVAHEAEELPSFVLADEPFDLVPPHLLVEGIEELLARGRAREGGPVKLRASEAAEVEKALGSAVEHDAHTVEQVDDPGRRVAHGLDGRLVGEKVAAIDGVVEVDFG
jgi:hypothetical protein